MSARDDYPDLDEGSSLADWDRLHTAMCAEIDRLRPLAADQVDELHTLQRAQDAYQNARKEIEAKWRDAGEMQRIIAPVLKRLYPQNPDVVLGREARAIAEALVAGGTDVWADTRRANWQHHGRDTRTIEEIAGVDVAWENDADGWRKP